MYASKIRAQVRNRGFTKLLFQTSLSFTVLRENSPNCSVLELPFHETESWQLETEYAAVSFIAVGFTKKVICN